MYDRSIANPLVIQGVLLLAAWSPIANELVAQDSSRPGSADSGESYPDGVTPSDVFARLDLLERQLDRVAEIKMTPAPEPLETDEVKLGPMHVYQIIIACSSRSQELSDQKGVLAVPTLSAKPRNYHPRDVRFVVDLMIDSVERVAKEMAIPDLPTAEGEFTGKTPTDVFNRASYVFLKLNALCGYDEIEPGGVFAEMVRITEDVRSILRQADSQSRYRIDAPTSDPDLQPLDVYKKCLSIRRVINKHRIAMGDVATRIPREPADDTIQPRHVFMQTQIILAELNQLKMLTKTTSNTPLAVPVNKTTLPSDAHQQASLVEHLLLQVKSGADVGLDDQPTNTAATID